jgi:glycosyltransferase involved in cell wall biosynthesis
MNKSLAILQNSYWSNGGSTSGGDQLTLELVKRGDFEGLNLTWISSLDGCNFAKKNITRTIEYKNIYGGPFQKNIWISYFIRTIVLIHYMMGKKFDIIYVNSDFLPDVIPAFIYKIINKNTKWIQCIFHIYPNYKIRPGNPITNRFISLFQKLSLRLIKVADTIHVINNQVKEYLELINFNTNKIILITPGIDVDKIKSVAIRNTITIEYDCIFLGRLSPSKGIHDLPRIWRSVVNIYPNSRLAIIGGGNENEIKKLKEQISQFSLENNIDILGSIDNELKYQLMSNCKIFAFPSHEEGFGIVIAEALCCGMNVIVWDLPVYKDLYEIYVHTIKYGDILMFSDKIIFAMENFNKKNIININFSSKYDWSIIIDKFNDLLKKLKYHD